MSLYSRYIFAPLMDWTLSRQEIRELRTRVVGQAAGDVLEIGYGTGLNLRFYQPEVKRLVLVDSDRLLPRRVTMRIAECRAQQIERTTVSAERLPFENRTFDCVVSTFTLCSIPDLPAALGEVRRVLRTDGRFVFLEHGQSDDARVARWQDRLNPLQVVIGCGCNLNRRIDQCIREANLEIRDLERPIVASLPRVAAEMYLGAAQPQTCPNSPTLSAT